MLCLCQATFAQTGKKITTTSKLQYQIIRDGSGAKANVTDKVTFNYIGKLEDGTVFDDSYKRGTPLEVAPNNMIKGLQEGLPLMTVGAKYIFYIPSNLAYGTQGAGGTIKPNSNLIFEVELLKINGKGLDVQIADVSEKDNNEKNDYKFYRKRAKQHIKDKNYKDALSDAEMALSSMPNDTSSILWRAKAKEGLNDRNGAIQDYSTLINMLGNEAKFIYFTRGILYELENKLSFAKADYQKMLELVPNDKDVTQALERVKTKEYNKVLSDLNNSLDKSLEKVKQLDPDRPFMKLIKTTNEEIKACTNRMTIINSKIKKFSENEKNIHNTPYTDLIIELSGENSNIYRIIKTRSKELEKFNDHTWPEFKGAYRKVFITSGAKETDLKEFDN